MRRFFSTLFKKQGGVYTPLRVLDLDGDAGAGGLGLATPTTPGLMSAAQAAEVQSDVDRTAAEALLQTALAVHSGSEESLGIVSGCGTTSGSTWLVNANLTETTTQYGPEGLVDGASKYKDNTSVAGVHYIRVVVSTRPLAQDFANPVRVRFYLHPGNLRLFMITLSGSKVFFDGVTGEIVYAAEETGTRGPWVHAQATQVRGGYYLIELVMEVGEPYVGTTNLYVYPAGDVTTKPLNGLHAKAIYDASSSWTDNTKYFHVGLKPRVEFLRATKQESSVRGGLVCSQSTATSTPLVSPYAWGKHSVLQWCAAATDQYFSCPLLAAALSGTAKPFTLSWLLRPQAHPATDKQVFAMSGTTAAFALTWGADGKWYVSRTTDAGATTTSTSLGNVGLVDHVLTLVYDGANVSLYMDCTLTGTYAIGGGATTFTAARFGAAVEFLDAERAVFSRALSAADVRLAAIGLGSKRGYDPTVPRKIILFGGQSLAHGSRYMFDGKPRTTGELRMRCWDCAARECSTYASELYTYRPWSPAHGSTDVALPQVGPQIGMADEAEVLGEKIGIIKYALTSTNLHTQWHPPSGECYVTFSALITTSLGQLGSVPYVVTALVFQQWNADADATNAPNYAANAASLIAAVRALVGVADLRVVWEYPHRDSLATYGATIRSQLESLAASDPNVTLVAHDDDVLLVGDSIHQTFDGSVSFGRRAIRVALI